jgi:acetyl esterase/lipase
MLGDAVNRFISGVRCQSGAQRRVSARGPRSTETDTTCRSGSGVGRFTTRAVRAAKAALIVVLVLAQVTSLRAEVREAVRLWDHGAPGALGEEDKDVPTLTPYLPDADRATGAAIVICPGGGYGMLAQHEGRDYALWLNQQGIAGFVLRYRLGSAGYRYPVMLQDAARAMRLVRARAGEWGVDPRRVGIMGSSAGGHLASTLLTHYDGGRAEDPDPIERQSSRPDLGILCYAVITMGEHTHGGSKQNLLGKEPPAELVELLSNERQVTRDTPPCFVWHTWEDRVVDVENALDFAAALRRNGVPFDLHVYQQGRHGIGLGDEFPFAGAHPWANDCIFWLKAQGFVRSVASER